MIILSTEPILPIFNQAIADYHKFDDVNHPCENPYEEKTIEWHLYHKAWIDTVQWHLEDLIRDPNIDPIEALALKRRIDKSNQDRTDIVEMIDYYYQLLFQKVEPQPNATLNTESPAWAIDRLSILQLKIYHMKAEATRADVSEDHKAKCQAKLDVLTEQDKDLCTAINQLMECYKKGEKVMKVYKQMKMYNDPALNPVLYGKKPL
ncbi:MAG: DUF4254 domain-containing protein [Bacteroidales bacterium]|nr:DUF4254 domain-containing protein [Bacteroidales bacterium]